MLSHKRGLARKRQANQRAKYSSVKREMEREKAKTRMQTLRKKRRMLNREADKKYNAERKQILRQLKKCGCDFEESSKIDVLQHNFLCYEKSLQWHICPICNKRFLRSSYNRISCHGHCDMFSAENHMDPKEVPPELLGLTYIEKQLICRVHSVFSLYKVNRGQYKYKGHVINFPQNVQSVADRLPHLIADLNNLVVVKLSDEIDLKDFHVRKSKVLEALLWLKKNNPMYHDIVIDEDRIHALPIDSNVYNSLSLISSPDYEEEIDDLSIFDDSQDENFHLSSSGVPEVRNPSLNSNLTNCLIWPAIGSLPVNEFGTPGYLTMCFPHLFPFGEADFTLPRKRKVPLSTYVQHLMLYKDERFAKDERFRYFMMNSQMRWHSLNLGNLYVKKNDFFSKMSVSQLKEYLVNNKSMVKQIMFYASRIRTTKSYWNSRCGELLDMVQQIGDPTVFFTLSAADFYWPNLFRLLGKDVNSLSVSERADLIAENPMVADSYFYLRSKFFIDHCFKPHFGVKDIWYRYEFQHRGSVHLHGLAWFENSPKLKVVMSDLEKETMLKFFDSIVSCENPDLNLIPSLQHPCQITLENVTDLNDDLAQLCNHVQRHTKCRQGFCLKKVGGKNDLQCKYKFPKALQPASEFEYLNNQIIDIAFKRNDPYLNKFNPWILQTWRANIDFSPIFSKEVVYRYIAKYASKSEVKSDTFNQIMTNILNKKCAESENSKQAIRKLLLSTCAERDYCAQEVIHFLMGYHFFEKSREVVIINLNQRDWVSISYGLGSNNVIDSYMSRPDIYSKLSIFEFSRWFYFRKGYLNKRKKAAVVRFFPRCVKEKNEPEYYQYMSQIFYPWRNIEDLSILGNDCLRYVDFCISHYLDIHDYSKDDFIDPDYGDNITSNPVKSNEQILSEFRSPLRNTNIGKRSFDLSHQWDRHSSKVSKENVQLLDQYLRKDVDLSDSHCCNYDFLNSDQLQFLKFIQSKAEALYNGEESEPIFCMLQGMPGTGKTYVLKACVKYLTDKLGSDSVKVIAPTGVAAKNANGSTVHSFLLLGKFGFNLRSLSGPELVAYREKYERIKFLFVEECSMVGLRMLSCLEKRCAEIHDSVVLFGGINIVFVGDINQLLPVGDQPLYADIEISSQTNNLLERGKLIIDELQSAFILKKCHRFANKNYVSFLKRVSNGRCTNEDAEIINKRCLTFLSNSELEKFNNCLRICTTNEKTNEHNLEKLGDLNCPIGIIKAQNNNQAAFSSSEDLADGLTNDLYLCEGAKIVLRKNLSISRGLVNGCVGFVRYIIYEKDKKPPTLPLCVLVKFENVYLSDLEISLVPVIPSVAVWYKGGVMCSRFQLPLMLCWACTIHRAQGLSLLGMVLDAGQSEFALGLLYVALSRVSDKEKLALVLALSRERLNSVTRHKNFKIRQKFMRKLKNMAKLF